jgi:hypothetical protein
MGDSVTFSVTARKEKKSIFSSGSDSCMTASTTDFLNVTFIDGSLDYNIPVLNTTAQCFPSCVAQDTSPSAPNAENRFYVGADIYYAE